MGIEANYYSSFQKNVAHILVGSGMMTEGLSSHSTIQNSKNTTPLPVSTIET